MPVTHTFVSAKPPAADPSEVGSAEWNAAHTLSIVNADVAALAAIDESKLNLNFPTHALATIGTANGLSLVGQALSLGLASAGVTGALSGADWSIFNAKGDVFGPASAVDNNLAAYNLATGKLIKDSGVLTSDVSSAVSLKHTRSHAITGTSDHTSSATPAQILKADANGLPIDATNTDAQVSAAVTASHAAVTLDVNADTLLSLSTQALGLDTQLANKVFAGATSGGAAVPAFRSLVAADIPALSYVDGSGVAGQVAEWVDSNTLQAAKIIGPASNILTLTNAAAATLGLNITAGKTLTLTAVDNYTLTIPATGTAALLATANVFTAGQTMQTTDGSTVLDAKFSKDWATLADLTPDTSDGGWGGYTLRQVINSSQITGASGAQQMRISIQSSGAITVAKCYIGHAAASGDAYDFETTPVQVTFDSGSAGYTDSSGGITKVSDAVNFVYSSGKNIVIAVYATGTSGYMSKVTQTGWQAYYKSGDDAATVNAGGYTSWFALTGMKKVEAGTPTLTSILTASLGQVGVPSVTASSVLSTDASSKLTAYTPTSNLPLLNGTQSFTGANTFSAINVRRSPGAFGAGTYSTLVLGDVVSGETTGAGMFSARYSSANAPFTAFTGFDDGTASRKLFFGGGGWGAPDATDFEVFTAPSYSETINTGLLRFDIGVSNGSEMSMYNHNTTNNAVATVLTLIAENPTASTGGANGFGAGLSFTAETATDGTNQTQALIATSWIDATNASRKAKLSLSAYDTAARLGIEIHADGTRSLVGIGGQVPTARLHLPIGSTAANTAPLKFTQDATSLLTAVEAGAMEYYHNSLWFTNLAIRRTVVQGQNVITANQTIANSTVETTIFTQNHGANYLQVGKCEEIFIQGIISSLNTGLPAANALTIRVKYAGATLGTFTVLKSATANRNYEIHVRITCRAIGSGTTTIQVHSNADVEGIATDPVFNGTSTGLDSTTAQATTVTVQWTDASASNTTTIQQGYALSIDNNA